MNRRTFLGTLTGGLLAAPLAAGAQSTPTVRRIGVVGIGEADPELVEVRKEGLRRLGWVEGQNIIVERLELPFGDTSSARVQEIARDLVRLKIEVIMASNNVTIAAAKAATTTIRVGRGSVSWRSAALGSPVSPSSWIRISRATAPSGSVSRPLPGAEAWQLSPLRFERLATWPALSPRWSKIACRPSTSSGAPSFIA